jgi:hypothetical protein
MTVIEDLGARIVFSHGAVSLAPPTLTPTGWAAARFSIISPGTELRRLAATATGDDHAAGYMTVAPAYNGRGLHLAPTPHGAAVDALDHRALPIPAHTSVGHIAVARFQLMAALGIARCVWWLRDAREVVVVGAGPVAVGCVLELRRVGVRCIRVVTHHPQPAVAGLPEVTVSTELAAASSAVVIDCTGRATSGLEMVATGGLLGLLGTPSDSQDLSAVVLHRRGITMVGMHELAADIQPARVHTFEEVLRWVADTIDETLAESWCQVVPGESAIEIYEALRSAGRPPAPFLILEWS